MKKIKWFFTEMMNIYSSKPSFFSKKRIESGIAFIIAEWGMIFFLLHKYPSLSMGEFILWASAQFAVAGYIISKIQKEKETQSVNDQITDSVTQSTPDDVNSQITDSVTQSTPSDEESNK